MRPPLSSASRNLRGPVTDKSEDRAGLPSDSEEDVVGQAWDVPKSRRCLRCRASFESAWSGERICGGCKKSHTWRSGEPAASAKNPGGRRRSRAGGTDASGR